MSRVSYGQPGYIGCSMSLGAAEAYDAGEKPMSKWTKAAMIAAIEEFCHENDRALDNIENIKKDEIFGKFFVWTSWHHTGKYARETDFYGIDEDAVIEASRELTEDEIAQRRIAAEKRPLSDFWE